MPPAAGEPLQPGWAAATGLPPPMMVECVGEMMPSLGEGFGGHGGHVGEMARRHGQDKSHRPSGRGRT